MSGTENPAYFFEQKFYCLSNASAFAFRWQLEIWMTAEHAYQASKFEDSVYRAEVRTALSPLNARIVAHTYKLSWRTDWTQIQLKIMEEILRTKLQQHSFVRRQLKGTGNRPIIMQSSTDSFWGCGADKNGTNYLGKIWMKLRAEV